MNARRMRWLREGPIRGPVVYWMSRDQRAEDNWALLTAVRLALESKEGMAAVFCLAPEFLGSTRRQYDFMLRGLDETAERMGKMGIQLHLQRGDPGLEMARMLNETEAGVLVTDFDPLRMKRDWKMAVLKRTRLPVVEVDAHNIVPCWEASSRLEYAAYTIRPKIHARLSEFLDDFPETESPMAWGDWPKADWSRAMKGIRADDMVPAIDRIEPGCRAARDALKSFIDHHLDDYEKGRNDPNNEGQSGLSPYLHFGQISAQRVALEVLASDAGEEAKSAFLEELIVRRELADNFCLNNPYYDSARGFPDWARRTLETHEADERRYLYSLEELERGETHDPLWNAAQMQMVRGGKMHGYMRMYWGKKMLEWTSSPEKAMECAIYLNDRYELDGRDPNGYAGIAWCMGGVHDRAWPERDVFGKIRYMSHAGARRKFDVDRFVETNLVP